MSQTERKSGLFVAPGDRLGVIEEFTPGSGTYVEHGTIHSKITGCTLLDMENKKVSVYPLVEAASVPQIGSIVSGQVLELKSKSAVLRILQIGKKSLSGFFTGVLHISDASPSYVDTMFSVCKTGDIMRAKVIGNKNRTFYLSTAEKNLGVIYALCSRCGNALQLGKRGMQCSRCGNIERRKVPPDYGEESTQEMERNES
jgi:exosome complex component CSL4